MSVIATGLLTLGVLLALAGSIGVIRFPDVFTRLHASTKCSTASLLAILLACVLVAAPSVLAGRILVIALFSLASNAVSSHAIGRSAWRRGVVPWRAPRRPRPGRRSEWGGRPA